MSILEIYGIGFVIFFIGSLIYCVIEDGIFDDVSFLVSAFLAAFWPVVVIAYPIRKFNEWRTGE